MAADTYTQKLGWVVGRAVWLDDPASMVNRYWRAMEYGQRYQGMLLIGLWGNRAGTNARPNELITGGPLAAPARGVRDQKFVPFSRPLRPADADKVARQVFWYYITQGSGGAPTKEQLSVLHGGSERANRARFSYLVRRGTLGHIPFVSAVAATNLPARNYYTNSVLRFSPMARFKVILREEASQLMSVVFSQSSARSSMAAETNAPPRSGRASKEVTQAEFVSRTNLGYKPGLGYGTSGLASVVATSSMQDLMRNANGQFPAGMWQNMLVEVNRRMAQEYQIAVVEEMEGGKRGRPPTMDLIKATKDPRNRYPT